MYTLFISDLHLDVSRPELTAIFLHLLATQAKQADALYILGDFFEIWLGDDVQSDFTQTISNALKALIDSGVPVYLMHGNRDFLIGQHFASQSGCQLLPDPTVINLYGTPVLLMHGDTLCWKDTQYQRFRRIARNPLYQRLFLALPLFIRRSIGQYLRSQSSHKACSATLKLSDATEDAITQALQINQTKLLIHGHTHRPSIHLNFPSPAFQKVVLSDWENQGNALIYSSDHTYRLTYFE